MAKRKEEDETRAKVQLPKFKTMKEQVAFQIGITLAFHALAGVFGSTTDAMLKKGELVLKDLGMTEADAEDLRNIRGGKKA